MLTVGAALLFLLTGLFALLGTYLVRGLALQAGIVSHPNPIVPQHTKPVAYLGGVGIVLGVVTGLSVLLALRAWGQVSFPGDLWPGWCVLVPGVLFLVLGTADDLLPLSAGGKFAFQAALAILAATLGLTHSFTGIRMLDAGISCFWILLLVNAFNLTDVCDGLVAGLALIIFLALSWLDGGMTLLGVAAAGACAGFLWLNLPPASIFLGDAGSHLLGFLAAALTLSVRGRTVWPYAAQMLVILGIPLFELIFLIAMRNRKGLPWWKGSADHFSLRLQKAGLSKLHTDLIAWAACIVLCGAAMAIGVAPRWLQIVILAGISGGFAVFWRLLLNWDVGERPTSAEGELSPNR